MRARLRSFWHRPPIAPDTPSDRAEPTYAQAGEDRILLALHGDEPPGFYVDIGAHHPTRFSNTALLYAGGWHGLNVDPMPGTKQLFARARPRDETFEIAIGPGSGMSEYFIFDDDALNTLSADRAAHLIANTRYRVVRKTRVPVMSLAQFLDEHLPEGQSIDLMNVDAEGLDMVVLRSNDWSRFRPRRLIVEDLAFARLDKVATATTVSFLLPMGYVPVAKTTRSVFFELPQN